MTAQIIRIPHKNDPTKRMMNKGRLARVHFYWLMGMDTLEIANTLGVKECFVYNSLNKKREALRRKRREI